MLPSRGCNGSIRHALATLAPFPHRREMNEENLSGVCIRHASLETVLMDSPAAGPG